MWRLVCLCWLTKHKYRFQNIGQAFSTKRNSKNIYLLATSLETMKIYKTNVEEQILIGLIINL